MAKYALGITFLSTVVVLTTWATSPPNLERTLEAQREIVAERPYDSTAHSDLGNLLLLADRVAAAEASYLRAKELDSANTAAGFNLALLMQQSGRADDAKKEFEAVLDADPKHAWAHYQLGVIKSANRRNRNTALEHYAKAFAIDSSLTFAENNPHIIDNELAVEALLLSSQYQQDLGARVPRHYADADRILDLMLENEENDAEEESEAAEELAAEESEGSTATVESRSEASASQPTQPRKVVRLEDDDDDDEEDELAAGEPPARRVLTNTDLEPSKGGAVQPRGGAVVRSGRSTSNAKVRSQPRYRRRSANTVDNGRAEQPEVRARPTTPTARPRYRPSRRSTANLTLKLETDEARG